MALYPPGSRLTSIVPFNFAAALSEVLGPSEKRIGLWLIGRPDVAVQYINQSGLTGHQAINIPSQAGPVFLTYENFGEGIKERWFGVTDTGVVVGGMIIEVLDNT